jgi:hypothetical protein
LKTLLPKSKALQLLQTIRLGSAIHNRIAQNLSTNGREEDCRFAVSATTIFKVLGVLQFPSVSALVVQQARIVVTLVEEFEDTG